MSERVTMPALGESVTEGTITRWLKSVGDQVELDEPLLEVSTDKVDTEIPSPIAGTLQEILAQEDDTVPVGADLAVIGEGGGESDASGDTGSADDSARGSSDEPAQAGADAAEDSQEAPAQQEPEAATEAADGGTDGGSDEPAPAGASADSGDAGDSGDSGDSGNSGGGSEGETVTMPALGESVTEGTVTRWLKAEGDDVTVNEPLLEVSTDKVDTEIPSPATGKLTKILAAEDETVEVGAKLAIIGGSGGAAAGGGGSSEDKQQAPPEQPQPEPEPEPEAEPEAESEPEPEAEPKPEGAEAAEPKPEGAEAAEPKPEGAEAAEPKEEAPAASEKEPSTAKEPGEEQKTRDPAGAPPVEPAAPAADAPSVAPPGSGDKASTGADTNAYVTPLVRKLAAQHGVDLAALTGTGVGGRIRKQDVLDAAESATAAEEESRRAEEAEKSRAAAPAAAASTAPSAKGSAAGPSSPGVSPKRGTREKMSRLRKVIAARMVESLQVSAQLTTVVEVDLTKVARLRARAKADFESREGTKLSFLPFLALAATEALKAHPNVNASVDGDEIVYAATENLAIAVDTEKGLIVPVVKNAGDLNIAGLARAIADVADRTRNNKITPDDLAGGTFTITNTGSRGALFDTPIINQPQVAILGTGAIVKRPVVITDADGGETIAIRSMMYLALSYDHRIVDGADAARFLGTMKARIEEGQFEASLGL